MRRRRIFRNYRRNSRRKIRIAILGSAGVTALGFLLTGARAQYISELFPQGLFGPGDNIGVTVLTRARPETDYQGVHAGGFLIQPRLGEGVGYDNNTTGATPGKGSALFNTTASVALNSLWSRNALGAYFSVNDYRYPAQTRQNYTDWTAAIGGALDIGRDRITAGYSHLSLNQTARTLDSPQLDAPGAFTVDTVRTDATLHSGRFTFIPAFTISDYHFQDVSIAGVPTSQALRDRVEFQSSLTLRYEVAPLRSVVLALRETEIRHTEAPAGVPSTDSHGVTVLAGFNLATSAGWNISALAGVQARSYASSAYGSDVAPVAEVRIVWQPTGLTTFTGTLDRRIEDAAEEGFVSYTLTSARLSVDHELRRDVLLGANATYDNLAYNHGGGTAVFAGGGASVTWLTNRRLHIVGSFDHVSKTARGGNYDDNILMVRFNFGL